MYQSLRSHSFVTNDKIENGLLNLYNLHSKMDMKLLHSLLPSVNMAHSRIYHSMVQVEFQCSAHAPGFNEYIEKVPSLLFRYVTS
jgi:hypothetical protein